MPETPRDTPTGTPFPGEMVLPDWMLVGKLDPPPLRVDAIERSAVLAQLEQSRSLPLTLLLAPPGFGKTTLLMQWYRHLLDHGQRVVWLGLDEDDADPRRLLGYLALAACRAGADRKLCEPLLRADPGPDPATATNLLVRAVRAMPHHATLLLDDYDRAACPATDRITLRLIEHAQPHLHLVLATRQPPALPLARLHSQGKLLRVHSARLSFDEHESRALLGNALAEDALLELHRNTEGWPVALHLARLWLDGDAAAAPPRFSGRSAELAAYLAEQVVNGLDPACRDFLLNTGPLQRFDMRLADHLRGSDDSGRLLPQLAHLHGLLIPLDHEHDGYRYHPLFADYLQQQLEREYPGEPERIRRRAALWFNKQGMLAEAVQHAALGNDIGLAANCLAGAGTWQLLLRHGATQVAAMLRHFDHATIRDTPALNLTQAHLHMKLGEHAHARLLLERFRDFPDAMREPFQRDYTIVVALLRGMFDELAGNPQAHVQLSAQMAALDADDHLGRGMLGGICATTALGQADFATAERHARSAYEHMRHGGNDIVTAHALLHHGQSLFQRGQFDAAEALYLQASVLAERNLHIDRMPAAAADCLLAQLHYQRGNLAEACGRLESSLAFAERHDSGLDLLASGYGTALGLARLRDRSGRSAMDLLDHVEQVARVRRLAQLSELAVAWRLQVMLDMPSSAGVDTLVAQSGGENGFQYSLRQPHRWHHRTALGFALARWHRLRGRSQLALDVLRQLEQACLADGNLHDLMRTRARIALVLQLRGDMDQALPVLHEVLDHVARQQAWQIVIELGLPTKAMLRSLRQHDPEVSTGTTRATTVQRLLDRMQHDNGDGGDFSEREREVLIELAAGHSNKQIGRRLHLSENTVKFHLKNLYRKLDANTRKAALDNAAQRGLLREPSSTNANADTGEDAGE